MSGRYVTMVGNDCVSAWIERLNINNVNSSCQWMIQSKIQYDSTARPNVNELGASWWHWRGWHYTHWAIHAVQWNENTGVENSDIMRYLSSQQWVLVKIIHGSGTHDRSWEHLHDATRLILFPYSLLFALVIIGLFLVSAASLSPPRISSLLFKFSYKTSPSMSGTSSGICSMHNNINISSASVRTTRHCLNQRGVPE